MPLEATVEEIEAACDTLGAVGKVKIDKKRKNVAYCEFVSKVSLFSLALSLSLYRYLSHTLSLLSFSLSLVLSLSLSLSLSFSLLLSLSLPPSLSPEI